MSSNKNKQNKRTSGRAKRRRPAKGKATAKNNRGGQGVTRGAFTTPTVIPGAYNIPRSSWAKSRQLKIDGDLVTEIYGCTPAFFVRRVGGGSPDQDPFQYINSTSGAKQSIVLHPIYVFPNLSNIWNDAATFTQYRFVRAAMSYDGRGGSGNNGSFLLSYYPDGGIEEGQLGSNQAYLYGMPGNVSIPIWASGPKTDFTPSLPKSSWYYVDNDDTSDASRRQSYQGAFVGMWDTSPPGDGYWGYIYMDFAIQLRNPRPYLDFTLQGGSRAEHFLRKMQVTMDRKESLKKFFRERAEKKMKSSFLPGLVSEDELPSQGVTVMNDALDVEVKSSVPVDSNISSVGGKSIEVSIVGDLDAIPVCGSQYAVTSAPLSVQGNVQAEVYNDSMAPLYVDQVPAPSVPIRPQLQPSSSSGSLPSISAGERPRTMSRVEGKSGKSIAQISGPPKN